MGRHGLALFLFRRLIGVLVVLLVMSFVVFALLYLAPGSPIDVLLGTRQRSVAVMAALRREYHLNDPFLVQYLHWLWNAVRFRFGESIANRVPVTEVIGQRLGVTLPLAGLAFLLTMVTGVAMGVAAALKRERALDRAMVGMSVIGISAPVFTTGLVLLYVFGVSLGWFPIFGTGQSIAGRLYHLVLPTVALALTGVAFIVKLTRTAMIAALEQDYIVFARARGLTRTRVVFAYALRNALVPIVTTGGIVLGGLLTGTVIIEVTFSLPGLGSLLVDSVNTKDIPVVQAIAILIAALIAVVNVITDVAYAYIDPRIRIGAGGES